MTDAKAQLVRGVHNEYVPTIGTCLPFVERFRSQFPVLGSRFSVLSSWFSVPGSRFSVLRAYPKNCNLFACGVIAVRAAGLFG